MGNVYNSEFFIYYNYKIPNTYDIFDSNKKNDIIYPQGLNMGEMFINRGNKFGIKL